MRRFLRAALLPALLLCAGCVTRPDGETTVEQKRSALDLIGKATKITSGFLHSCALLETGRVFCWGRGLAGQLGDGNALTTPEPVEVQGLTDATAIFGGYEETCAIRQGGQAVCWGDDDPRHPVGSPLPVVVSGMIDAVSIAPGPSKTCAARSNGSVVCWGAATTASPTLVPVAGLSDATTVVTGDQHMCALRSTGEVACWGSGFFSQLGNGSTASSDVPVAVSGLTDAVAIAAGSFHTCAVRSGGQVVCWGTGGNGRLGDGLSTTSAVPVTVADLTDAVDVAAGGVFSCAVRANGALACWGIGFYLGNGSDFGTTSPVPVAAVGLTDVVSVAAGGAHVCALQGDGEVLCWGQGDHGQLGNGRFAEVAEPVPVVGVTDAVSVDGSAAHTCAVRTTGTVACWGQDDNGSLGDGSTVNVAYTPVAVVGLSDAVMVAVGHSHSCALRATREVACWGTGGQGQLGNGSSGAGVSSGVPVAVTGLSDAVALAAGESQTCALREGGGVVCWGAAVPLGSGSLGNASSPVAVPGLSDAVGIGAHGSHACAVRAGGAVVCWGAGAQGRLGNGGTDDSAVPVPVSGLTDAVAVMPGQFHTCAVRAGGGVVCWGDNSNGQLGTTAVGSVGSLVPVAVPGLSDAKSGGSGVWHTCVRRTTGAVACWGASFWGQLGNGVMTDEPTPSPVAVVGLTDAVLVEAGGYTTCAIRSGGALSCWGEGTQGQLGNGQPWRSNVPIGVLGLSIPRSPLGDACMDDDACATRHCVDGVCCESDCNSADSHRCVACAAGTGACTPHPAGTPCRDGSGNVCDLGGLCDGTSDTCPISNTPALSTTPCHTRGDLCESVEEILTCGGGLTCQTGTSWSDGCGSVTNNVISLLGGIDGTAPAGGVQITFTTPYTGKIAAKRVKLGCPDKPGFDVLPKDTAGDGYYWELIADPPITCASGQMDCTQMEVCVKYADQWITDAGWGDVSTVEGTLQLLHGISPAGGGDGCDPATAGWKASETESPNTTANTVCTPANSLSPFGLFIPKPGSVPTLHLPAKVVAAATGPAGVTVTYVATATDPQDGALTPSCVPASGAKFPLGSTTVKCTVVDHDSVSVKGSFPVQVQYQAPTDGTFFGQPINADGSSIFKRGSTVPVKFRLTGASAGVTNAVARLYTANVSNGVTGTSVEAETNVASDGGNTFRYDSGQYIYNLSTKSLTTGTWSLRVDLGDGVDHSVKVSLK